MHVHGSVGREVCPAIGESQGRDPTAGPGHCSSFDATLSAPDDDQVSYTREDLLGKIKMALGSEMLRRTPSSRRR